MHQREVLAAGGGTLSDTMHVVLGGVTVFLMFLAIGFGATAFGKRFRALLDRQHRGAPRVRRVDVPRGARACRRICPRRGSGCGSASTSACSCCGSRCWRPRCCALRTWAPKRVKDRTMNDVTIARITGVFGIACVAPDVRPVSVVARRQSSIRVRRPWIRATSVRHQERRLHPHPDGPGHLREHAGFRCWTSPSDSSGTCRDASGSARCSSVRRWVGWR